MYKKGIDFTVQRCSSQSKEAIAIVTKAHRLGLAWRIANDPVPGTIPIGSVKFCLPLAKSFPVDFFPQPLRQYFNRPHYRIKKAFQLDKEAFVKDLTSWKTAYETKPYPAGYCFPAGNWLVSEPIDMINEWRYYVVAGEVVTTGWYRGLNEDKEAPIINFPKNVTGAIDFAETPEGIELIEAHAPFACGWYSEEHENYVIWQYMAWKETKKNEHENK